MKKLLSILLTTAILFAEEGSNYFMDNFLKYSTFYTSVSVNSPFVPLVKRWASKWAGDPIKNPKGKQWVKDQLRLKKAGIK